MFTYREISEENRKILIEELKAQNSYTPCQKDIIIVVHNQYEHVKKCLSSIKDNTSDYNLFIWDNASDNKTKKLLRTKFKSETNIGFIKPNNILAQKGSSPYLILLNSDTIVSSGWDEAMIGLLQKDDKLGVIGYCGGKLDKNFRGREGYYGKDIDYVSGWCLCFPRSIYEKLGLFDENLQFAYGEDSDFCMKLKKNNYDLYALHLNYVKHIGNATAKNVPISEHFFNNHQYLQKKWSQFA